MKKISYLIFAATFLSSFFGFGQDTLAISKSELVQKVAEKNLQIKIAQKTYQSAKADYEQSNSLFLPNINVSHTGISTTNPLMAFGSKLNQEILNQADFNPALLNDPAKTQNFATKFEIQQPLINVDGIYGRQAAKAKMEAYQLQTERTKEYLELEVSKAFMQLQLAYRAVKVLEKANVTGKANLKLVDNYFKQGMLQKTDLLNVQVRVNEIANQLQYAKSEYKANKSAYYPALSLIGNWAWQENSKLHFFDNNARWIPTNYIGLRLSYTFPDAGRLSQTAAAKTNWQIAEMNVKHKITQQETENVQLHLEFKKVAEIMMVAEEIKLLKEDTYRKNLNLFVQDIYPADNLFLAFNDALIAMLNYQSAVINLQYQLFKININNSIR